MIGPADAPSDVSAPRAAAAGRRVAHLTTVHGRRDVRIFEKETRTLAAAGFEVYLLVGDGRGDERVDGVQVLDIGAAPPGRLRRMLRQPLLMLRAARRLHADVYHFHDPELLWVGALLQLGGAHVVYDSHEDVPRDILSKDWIAPALRRTIAVAFERLENFVARRLSAVVAATPHIATRFAEIGARSIDINNYPADAELARATPPTPAGAAPGNRVLCYIGGIGRIRGVIEMVKAMERVDAILVMAGAFEGPDTEAETRALPGWQRVDYRGTVGREEVRRLMAGASAGLLLFHPEPNHVDAQPNKMFEYMSAGLPVVASDFPLWRRVLVDEGAGVCVDPMDPAAIAAAIDRLLHDAEAARQMGERGRSAVQARYRWSTQAARLVGLYDDLLGSYAR